MLQAYNFWAAALQESMSSFFPFFFFFFVIFIPLLKGPPSCFQGPQTFPAPSVALPAPSVTLPAPSKTLPAPYETRISLLKLSILPCPPSWPGPSKLPFSPFRVLRPPYQCGANFIPDIKATRGVEGSADHETPFRLCLFLLTFLILYLLTPLWLPRYPFLWSLFYSEPVSFLRVYRMEITAGSTFFVDMEKVKARADIPGPKQYDSNKKVDEKIYGWVRRA